jgi:hypothetical protein
MAEPGRRCGGCIDPMACGRVNCSLALAVVAVALLGGCAVAQSTPPKPRPFGEIAREERGEVVTVRDTRIDLRTGMGRAMQAHTPRVPVGPIAVGLPVTIGGEKRVEVPGEEITVRLPSGKMILIVQELSSPPFAPGERVRVLYERKHELTGESRTRIERE